MTADKHRALAELRYRLRRILPDGDAVARASGLEPQQYLMLLAIRGLPQGGEATIRTLAEARRSPMTVSIGQVRAKASSDFASLSFASRARSATKY